MLNKKNPASTRKLVLARTTLRSLLPSEAKAVAAGALPPHGTLHSCPEFPCW